MPLAPPSKVQFNWELSLEMNASPGKYPPALLLFKKVVGLSGLIAEDNIAALVVECGC